MTPELIANGISLTVLLAYIIPLAFYIYTHDTVYLLIEVAVILIGILVEQIKPLFDSPRPEGARGCGLFCDGGDVTGRPGFPSGHVSITTLFVLLMAAYQSPYWLLGLIWIGLMGWSRYEKHCHSVNQVLAGFATGTIGAGISIVIYQATMLYGAINLLMTMKD